MALSATIHRFEIELADSDRGVYESLELRVARHPSESGAFLIVRLLAFCLEHTEGIAFSKGGISAVEDPAISIFDLTGQRTAWIEVGAPSADRLHRASKSTGRVALYTDRRIELLRTSLAGERIHRAEAIVVICFQQPFLKALESQLERTTKWHVSRSDSHLYVNVGGASFDMPLEPQSLAG